MSGRLTGRLWGALVLAAMLLLSWGVAIGQEPTRRISAEDYYDKVLGGWLGKNIGVLYGEPNEFALRWTKANGEWQVWHNDHREDLKVGEWLHRVPDVAHDQDDIYINLIYLEALEKYGLGATGEQIAACWLENNPAVWCANKAALGNMRYGIWPPLSGHPAFSRNTTDIDAQIECDLWGMIAPGMINASADIARKGAYVTNFGEGAYAPIYLACVYSEAFFEPNIRKCMETALAKIPDTSLYAGLVRDCFRWKDQFSDWHDARMALAEKYEKLGSIHAALNSGAVFLGLLYGDGDYDKTLFVSTMCGWDSDCNPSTAAGILGVALGASRTPAKWKDPMKDIYRGHTVKAYAPGIKISELAQKTVALGEKAIEANGGKIVEEGGKKLYVIPVQPPSAPVVDEATPEEIERIRSDVVRSALREIETAGPDGKALAIRRLLRVAQLDKKLVSAEAVEKVAAMLGFGDGAVASNAALLVGTFGDKRAMEGLAKAAEDSSSANDARVEALAVLQGLNKEPGVAARIIAVMKAAAADKRTAEVACAAVEALHGADGNDVATAIEAIKSLPADGRERLAKSIPQMAKGASPETVRAMADLMEARYPNWDPAWTVVSCGSDMNPGVRPEYLGRKNVLMTHPLDRQIPCRLVQEVELAAGKRHSLDLVVSSHSEKGADWELRVLANGEEIAKQTIGPVNGEAAWQTLRFDLSKYAGKKVTVELQNAANSWAWEAGYWASAKIVTQ